MKVAVCVSGLCKGKVQRNMDYASEILNIDKKHFFYSTWEGREKDCIDAKIENFYTFKEPTIDYHPLADIPESIMPQVYKTWCLRKICQGNTNITLKNKIKHQTKQIFGHSYLLEKVPEEYDMIVRIRYDTYITPKLKQELRELLKLSYSESKTIGFGTRIKRHSNMNILKHVPHDVPERHGPSDRNISNDWYGYIMDPMIFHRRNMFNSQLVLELHDKNSLLSAERGWYQILSQPFNDNHECFYGGAQIEKFLPKTNY